MTVSAKPLEITRSGSSYTVKGVKPGWILYVLRCRDKSLYCGITNNLPRRLLAHNDGKGSKYTRPGTRRPILFVAYACHYPNRSEASKAEYAFKQLSKKAKELVVRNRKLWRPYGKKKVRAEIVPWSKADLGILFGSR